MKALLIGTAKDEMSPTQGNLAGFLHGYVPAFREIGWWVDGIMHEDMKFWKQQEYDLVLMRDTFNAVTGERVNPEVVNYVKKKARKFGFFGHAEFIQGAEDVPVLKEIKPDHIFLDQPYAARIMEEVGAPTSFLGFGANDMAGPAKHKDIDILWIGHAYDKRQERVERYIFPLRNSSEFEVRIHGRDQPDGPLNLPDMFDVMGRSRVLVRMSHEAQIRGGYGCRTLFDAMASDCFVVSDGFAGCSDQRVYPWLGRGVYFARDDESIATYAKLMTWASSSAKGAQAAGKIIREKYRIKNVAERMIEALFGGDDG